MLLIAPALFAGSGAAASNDPQLTTTTGAVDDIDYSNYLDRVEREAAKKEKALEARTPSPTADRVHTAE